MRLWRWVPAPVIFAIHDRQIAEHGGLDGVRDLNAVYSALARPQHLASYSEPDSAALAASYLFGLVRNHGFNDGNKRTAWVVARLFCLDNDITVRFDPHEAIATVEAAAGGKLDETQLAAWFRNNQIG